MCIIKSSEWHQAMKAIKNPIDSCVVLPDNRRTFDSFQSFVVALAKSQDHRVIYGVFSFGGYIRCGTSMVVCLGNPVTRASQSGGRGLIPRARWLKQSGIVRCDELAPKSRDSKHRANFVFEHGKAVLCSKLHQKANMKRDKQRVVEYYKGKSANEVSELIKTKPDFMKSEEWFVLKAKTIAHM